MKHANLPTTYSVTALYQSSKNGCQLQKGAMTLSMTTLGITTLTIMTLSKTKLSITLLWIIALCHIIFIVMLNVLMLSVIMLTLCQCLKDVQTDRKCIRFLIFSAMFYADILRATDIGGINEYSKIKVYFRKQITRF
jgi:hypothetical protein